MATLSFFLVSKRELFSGILPLEDAYAANTTISDVFY